jgi:integral membrane protein (TIGR00529 family)
MSIFEFIPAIVRVIMVFILVLICIRKKLSLGHAFMLGAAFLSILFGLTFQAILNSVYDSITDLKTVSIALIVSLILVLSNSMELAGQMQRLLGKFQGLVSSPRLNLVIFPALIGLLPMPGGAVFSAPMVKELGIGTKLSGAKLSFVNYWFRHIWEHWWPLYPGILLTAVMTDMGLAAIMLLMFPFTLLAVWLGYRALKDCVDTRKSREKRQRPPVLPFIRELVPILIAILPGFVMGVLLSKAFSAFPISKEIGLIFSLGMAIGWVWYDNGTPKDQVWDTLLDPGLLKMIYMIAAILIFKGILADSKAAVAVGKELVQLHIPLVLIAVILPFLVGMSGGIVIACVGAALPILLPLIYSLGEAWLIPAYVMLVLASGFAGVMLSPLHLCFQLSNEYFGATMGSVYKYLWLPCLVLTATGIGYFWILYWLYQWI